MNTTRNVARPASARALSAVVSPWFLAGALLATWVGVLLPNAIQQMSHSAELAALAQTPQPANFAIGPADASARPLLGLNSR